MNDGEAAPMKSQYCGYLNKTWTITSEDTWEFQKTPHQCKEQHAFNGWWTARTGLVHG